MSRVSKWLKGFAVVAGLLAGAAAVAGEILRTEMSVRRPDGSVIARYEKRGGSIFAAADRTPLAPQTIRMESGACITVDSITVTPDFAKAAYKKDWYISRVEDSGPYKIRQPGELFCPDGPGTYFLFVLVEEGKSIVESDGPVKVVVSPAPPPVAGPPAVRQAPPLPAPPKVSPPIRVTAVEFPPPAPAGSWMWDVRSGKGELDSDRFSRDHEWLAGEAAYSFPADREQWRPVVAGGAAVESNEVSSGFLLPGEGSAALRGVLSAALNADDNSGGVGSGHQPGHPGHDGRGHQPCRPGKRIGHHRHHPPGDLEGECDGEEPPGPPGPKPPRVPTGHPATASLDIDTRSLWAAGGVAYLAGSNWGGSYFSALAGPLFAEQEAGDAEDQVSGVSAHARLAGQLAIERLRLRAGLARVFGGPLEGNRLNAHVGFAFFSGPRAEFLVLAGYENTDEDRRFPVGEASVDRDVRGPFLGFSITARPGR